MERSRASAGKRRKGSVYMCQTFEEDKGSLRLYALLDGTHSL